MFAKTAFAPIGMTTSLISSLALMQELITGKPTLKSISYDN